MSDQNMARRTAVETSFDGVDITRSIRPYLLSVTYTDNEADKADDLQIKLQDRDSLWLESWLDDIINAAASGSAATASGPASYRVTPRIGLNVRAGPGTDHRRLGALTCGTVVEVSAIENGWAVIDYRGAAAYVCAAYLSPVGGTVASA